MSSAAADKPANDQDVPTPVWVTPKYAVIVVAVAAVVILAILGWSLVELSTVPGSGETAATADPNAGTIAALASSAFTALASLSAAYFGIKVAGEQSAQATDTANKALGIARTAVGNSTTNGNPTVNDITGESNPSPAGG